MSSVQFLTFVYMFSSCDGRFLLRFFATGPLSTLLHLGLTRAQQSGFRALLVRFPTLVSNRHTGLYRVEFEISPQKRVYPSPFRGRGCLFLNFRFLDFLMQRSPVPFRKKRQ